MIDKKEFTIDRAIWLRGEGGHASRLLRSSDSKMCCVGIYLEACGVPRNALLNERMPCDISTRYGKFPQFLDTRVPLGCVYDSDCLMATNDKVDLDETVRETRITQIFANNGVKVQFV